MSFDTLTIEEAAKRIHMHPQTLRRRLKAGDLEVTRVGGRVLLRTDLFQAWLLRSTGPHVPRAKAA